MRPLAIKDILSISLVALLIATAQWAKFSSLPVWLIAAYFLLLVYLSKAWGSPTLQQPLRAHTNSEKSPRLASIIVWTAIICAPSVLLLILTWHQEAPMDGDQLYHSGGLLHSWLFWSAHWIPPAVISAIIAAGFLFPKRINLCWLAIPFFLVVDHGLPANTDIQFAMRYPALLYFLELPFFGFTDGHNILNAQRFFNILSLPVWLLVLRPLLVKRWPDIRILPFAAFLFFQKDIVYYMASGYLEPWPLVITILALECLLVRPAEDRWIAGLLIITAVMMKDQFVFLLPLILFSGLPPKKLLKNTPLLAAGIIGGLLSLSYYILRRTFIESSRVYRMQPWVDLTNDFHLDGWLHAFLVQWQSGWPILIVSIGLLSVCCLKKKYTHRSSARAIAFAGALMFVLFFCDVNEYSAPAYPRYYMLLWAVLGAGLLIAGYEWKTRYVRILSLCILMLNGIPLSASLVTAAGPDSGRNFLEHTTCSQFYPLRTIVRQAEKESILKSDDSLRFILDRYVWQPKTKKFPVLDTFGMYYDIRKQYTMTEDDDLQTDAITLHQCRCSNPGEAAVFFPMFFTNKLSDTPARAKTEETDARCLAMLHETCDRYTETTFEGRITGFLGISHKKE